MATASVQPASAASPAPDPAVFDHLHHQLQTRSFASPIYAFLLAEVRLIHASAGHVIARLTLGPNHTNSAGGLHGGVSASLVDWAGGMAVAAHDLRARTGVSIDMHLQYLASAAIGEEVEIDGRADRVGANIAYTTVAIYRVIDHQRADPLVLGRHTKFVRGTAASPAAAPTPAPVITPVTTTLFQGLGAIV